MKMIIDATDKFLEKTWRKNVEDTLKDFVEEKINLDDFILGMRDLGYDNVLTRSVVDDE